MNIPINKTCPEKVITRFQGCARGANCGFKHMILEPEPPPPEYRHVEPNPLPRRGEPPAPGRGRGPHDGPPHPARSVHTSHLSQLKCCRYAAWCLASCQASTLQASPLPCATAYSTVSIISSELAPVSNLLPIMPCGHPAETSRPPLVLITACLMHTSCAAN